MQQILQYMLTNPTAKDTAAGIQLWWLDDEHPRDIVEESLRELENLEWISAIATRTGPCLYGLNPETVSAAREFVGGAHWPT
jgi:hypothetical protein